MELIRCPRAQKKARAAVKANIEIVSFRDNISTLLPETALKGIHSALSPDLLKTLGRDGTRR
jgi:hypothetical protein